MKKRLPKKGETWVSGRGYAYVTRVDKTRISYLFEYRAGARERTMEIISFQQRFKFYEAPETNADRLKKIDHYAMRIELSVHKILRILTTGTTYRQLREIERSLGWNERDARHRWEEEQRKSANPGGGFS